MDYDRCTVYIWSADTLPDPNTKPIILVLIYYLYSTITLVFLTVTGSLQSISLDKKGETAVTLGKVEFV